MPDFRTNPSTKLAWAHPNTKDERKAISAKNHKGYTMKTMHLFAGIGGGLYADLILGHDPIAAVEINPYCCQILRQKAEEGWFPNLQVHEQDIQQFDPTQYKGKVDCIAAGFPCNNISVAGKGEGIHGQKSSLFFAATHIISLLRPHYVFLENVPALLVRGLHDVLGEMVKIGYDCRWTILSAKDVGAPHLRKRWWCLCTNTDTNRRNSKNLPQPKRWLRAPIPSRIRKNVPHSNRTRLSKHKQRRQATPHTIISHHHRNDVALPWSTEPNIRRVAHGIPHRRHRIEGLGNAQVPLQAALAWTLLNTP